MLFLIYDSGFGCYVAIDEFVDCRILGHGHDSLVLGGLLEPVEECLCLDSAEASGCQYGNNGNSFHLFFLFETQRHGVTEYIF